MKNLLLAIGLIATVFQTANAFTKVPTKTGDYCKDEIVHFVDDYFGGSIDIKNISFATEYVGNERRSWRAWVKVDACSGYLVFTPGNFSPRRKCTGPHYGKKYPHYVRRVYATKDCRELLPTRSLSVDRRRADF